MKKTLHEGKNPFQCKMCDNTYSTKGNLTRHVDKIHGKNESDQKSKVKKEHASLSDNDKLEKNPVTTIKEVIFCQEILGQYCYKIEQGRENSLNNQLIHPIKQKNCLKMIVNTKLQMAANPFTPN